MKSTITAVLLLLVSNIVHATPPAVYKISVKQDFDTVYSQVFSSLEKHRFFVVLEPDIGKNMSGFAKRWGEDYNRNKLERIQSMVFCNVWYANQVANADPDMLGMCPLHISLTYKAGITSILFIRPEAMAAGSKAEKIAAELTRAVIKALEEGAKAADQ